MAKKEITITFRTITPLWTGDAWQEDREIRPSSLIGSLRFWFETIMYFADVLNDKDFNPQNGRFEKEVNRKELRNFRLKNGNDIKEIINHLLHEQKIPISSVIFGTTNWRSLIEIKDIFDLNKFSDYKYYLGTLKFTELKHNGKIPTWYFPKGFYGKFKVKFLVEKNILDSIFYPLLTFMDKYGFWGGKWNIGYGRLKVESVEENNSSKNNWRKSDFELPNGICFSWNKLQVVNDFNELMQFSYENRKIKIFEYFVSEDSFEQSVKELIKLKAQKRANYRKDTELRHKVFGTTKSPPKKDFLPQGSKNFPYITYTPIRDKFPYDCGFLSIAGLLNLEDEINEEL